MRKHFILLFFMVFICSFNLHSYTITEDTPKNVTTTPVVVTEIQVLKHNNKSWFGVDPDDNGPNPEPYWHHYHDPAFYFVNLCLDDGVIDDRKWYEINKPRGKWYSIQALGGRNDSEFFNTFPVGSVLMMELEQYYVDNNYWVDFLYLKVNNSKYSLSPYKYDFPSRPTYDQSYIDEWEIVPNLN